MTGTTELVPLTKADLVAWMRGDEITDDDNTDEMTYDLALRILQADDQAAVLSKDDVRPVNTLIDASFVVTGVTWRKSTKSEDGAGRYAVMSCVDGDGVKFLSSCGATKVVLQLRKAELEGWFPWKVQLDAVTTSNNRTMYELAPPQADF